MIRRGINKQVYRSLHKVAKSVYHKPQQKPRKLVPLVVLRVTAIKYFNNLHKVIGEYAFLRHIESRCILTKRRLTEQ